MIAGRLTMRWSGDKPDAVTPIVTLKEDELETFARRWFRLRDIQELVSAGNASTTTRAWSATSDVGNPVTILWEPMS